ncbi:MAG: excinuclease ABC subunit UvrA [Flavobacteriales bacterium]|nr:excinuclease ABC subunit UvrA [Flavobacteriales bacterium]
MAIKSPSAKQKEIEIKGARVHNLKNVDVKIPHGKFTVITGLSGSGKSSLAFDTLYAEGQRRYIESLSSYARQFLGKLDKPEADYIKGIAPAIAIEQKVISNNPRSTVGTSTEIYDYLKVLFTRIGRTISPISGNEVKKHNVSDVVDFLRQQETGDRCLILCPLIGTETYGPEKRLELLKQQGYVRLWLDDAFVDLDDILEKAPKNIKSAFLVIDRIALDFSDDNAVSRYGDSVQLAFIEGGGECVIRTMKDDTNTSFSNRFELDGMEFQVPTEHFFTFNNPFGACKTCEGFGQVIGIDRNLVIPNRDLSVYEGAVAPWKGEKMGKYRDKFVDQASDLGFPIHRAVAELSDEELELLWNGKGRVKGINDFFKMVESKSYKIQYRVMLSRYRGKTDCHDCRGTRLRKDANYVKVEGKSITDIVLSPIKDSIAFFENLEPNQHDLQITKKILPEIQQRLQFLDDVGLGYLTLNRRSNSLSGGESQRINLATSLGSSLVGSMYILDEPSIGLHPKDTERLIKVLYSLRDIGNTVIVVEHEEDIMKAADEIIDIGPMAGAYGGEIVFQGTHKQLPKAKNSLTADYLTGKENIPVPERRRKTKNKLSITGARQHNLKNVDVDFPLNSLVCVTGVSGSGKSTLVREILLPAVRKELGIYGDQQGDYRSFSGDVKTLKSIEFVDQNPIGKSSRSNPVTYVKAFDDIRDLFARQPLAKARNYKPGFFSFNVDGGRCEVCDGEGSITVGMQFMADVHLPCEQCKGTRYKAETLDILYREKSIADVLDMDVSEAFDFFKEGDSRTEEKIVEKIEPLVKVGLGYLKLGQPSSTLSGGEAQRIKLASFLSKGKSSPATLFIFDEPTTGLHFHDVNKLVIALNELINAGHSVIVIEHNLDVIKCADYLIDMGPGGGNDGGNVVFAGTPEDIVKEKKSHTGRFLKEKL